eukprot:jgi/Botrbrau1/8927/Bobra.0148s0040.1
MALLDSAYLGSSSLGAAQQTADLEAYLTALAAGNDASALQAPPWGEAVQLRAMWSAAAASRRSPRGLAVSTYLAPAALGAYLGVLLRDGSNSELALILHGLLSRRERLYPDKAFWVAVATLTRSFLMQAVKRCPALLRILYRQVSAIITAEPISETHAELAVTLVTLLGEAWPMEGVPISPGRLPAGIDVRTSIPGLSRLPHDNSRGFTRAKSSAPLASRSLAPARPATYVVPHAEAWGPAEPDASSLLQMLETLVFPALDLQLPEEEALASSGGGLQTLACAERKEQLACVALSALTRLSARCPSLQSRARLSIQKCCRDVRTPPSLRHRAGECLSLLNCPTTHDVIGQPAFWMHCPAVSVSNLLITR